MHWYLAGQRVRQTMQCSFPSDSDCVVQCFVSFLILEYLLAELTPSFIMPVIFLSPVLVQSPCTKKGEAYRQSSHTMHSIQSSRERGKSYLISVVKMRQFTFRSIKKSPVDKFQVHLNLKKCELFIMEIICTSCINGRTDALEESVM